MAQLFEIDMVTVRSVTRNLSREGLKMENFCDAVLMTYFGDTIFMTP